MADYWDKFYGPAAEAMERYWMDIDQAFCNLPTEAGSYHALHHVYTPERLQRLGACLAEAERAVAGRPDLAYRVNLARRGFQRAGFWRAHYEAVNRGDYAAMQANYDAWYAFVCQSVEKRHANLYAEKYLRRYVKSHLDPLGAMLAPSNAPPRRITAVLPDVWRTATGAEVKGAGATGEPFDAAYVDTAWREIRTFSDTRNAQGLPDYFGPMWYRVAFKAPASEGKRWLYFYKADRLVTVYINGRQVNAEPQEAFRGVAVDVSAHLRAGTENCVVVRVDHVPLPELFLGGLAGPVYLVEGSDK
jgi:hypothetical protein